MQRSRKSSPPIRDGRLLRGTRTRGQILSEAVHIASQEGLEGLTIGRLARETGMSKSGLFAHFGSKEDLQLAVVEQARDIFITAVIQPSMEKEGGLERLRSLLEHWVSYMESDVFRGGCFFAAASTEFDGRPGPVRDRIRMLLRRSVGLLEEELQAARSARQIDASADPEQVAFELHGLLQEANWAYQLFESESAFERARRGIAARLDSISTKERGE